MSPLPGTTGLVTPTWGHSLKGPQCPRTQNDAETWSSHEGQGDGRVHDKGEVLSGGSCCPGWGGGCHLEKQGGNGTGRVNGSQLASKAAWGMDGSSQQDEPREDAFCPKKVKQAALAVVGN